ncbi:MAG: hypothetical protein WCN92_03065 [Eubacteriales bacterium]
MKTGKTAAIIGFGFAAIASGAAVFYYVCKNKPVFKQKVDVVGETAVRWLADIER